MVNYTGNITLKEEEKFSFWKLIGGFWPSNGKNAGKLIHLFTIMGLGFLLYTQFVVEPALTNAYTNNINNPENVVYNQQTMLEADRDLFFGIHIAKFKIGISYEKTK